MLNAPKLNKPRIGGDLDIWGNKLNDNVDKQDEFNKQIIIDSYSKDEEISRLDTEKINKKDLDTFVKNVVDNYIDENTKSQLNEHVESINKPELDRYTDTKKLELNNTTIVKKEELDVYEKTKESELTAFVEDRKNELVQHVETISKIEINSYTEKKKQEINTFTEDEKLELDAYEKLKEGQLENFKDEKKAEITSHINAEIEKINATGIYGKQDKIDNTLETKDKTVVGAINELLNEKENLINKSNAIDSESTTDVATSKAVNDLRLEVDKKTINAGNGLSGGGIFGNNISFDIVSDTDGILIKESSIMLNISNTITEESETKPCSIKVVNDLNKKLDKNIGDVESMLENISINKDGILFSSNYYHDLKNNIVYENIYPNEEYVSNRETPPTEKIIRTKKDGLFGGYNEYKFTSSGKITINNVSVSGEISTGTQMWSKHPNGEIIQKGETGVSDATNGYKIYFPISFSGTPSVVYSIETSSGVNSWISEVRADSFKIYTSNQLYIVVRWIALGY